MEYILDQLGNKKIDAEDILLKIKKIFLFYQL